MDRYPVIMAGIRKKNLILDETLEKSLHPLETIKYALPLENVEQKILELAGKRFSGSPIITEEENARHYFFEKGKYSRLAFFFTHLSILMIFTGGIIGSLAGYKGYVTIFEQEAVSNLETRTGDVKKLNFTVKCNSFNVDFYPNGMPRDYRTNLSIIKDGKEVARKTIRVNDPVTFEGVTFYQSSYGVLLVKARIKIRNKDGALKGEVTAPFGKRIDIPGATDKIEVADYQEHFHLEDGSDGGPALGVNLYREKEEPSGLWLLEEHPEYDKHRRSDYYFTVEELTLNKYTGLQVNKDPGEWVVWFGFLMLITGIMIALFVSHKKLWIKVRKEKKSRIEITVGGTANKNRTAFVSEIKGIIKGLKEIS
jgi:cytochrome c biogenesis protein